MPRKRLLLVGNGNSVFLINLAIWLRKKNVFPHIDIISDRPVLDHKVYNNVFGINKNTLVFHLSKHIRVQHLLESFLYKRLAKQLGPYDSVHAHFMNATNQFILSLFPETSRIASIWGSDIYSINYQDRNKLSELHTWVNRITFTNNLTLEYYKLGLGKIDVEKLSVCRFGLAPLTDLRSLKESKEESKRILGWDIHKVAIIIGYNGARNQQHLTILKEVAKLENKGNIHLVFPLTYGSEALYTQRIIDKVESIDVTFMAYTSFLSNKDVARIRNASDIMIQLQKTDQFSGSMQEHLYARNVVITGSWLPYETMKDHGIVFEEISNVENLSLILSQIIDNYESYSEKTTDNPEAIYNLSSWERNIEDWAALYQ